MKWERGFTLIEVVVVIAVVALLAAIMTPLIAKNIDDAKQARAENEVSVIAASLSLFYKDVGHWPTMDTSGKYNQVTTLVSGNAASVGGGINSNGWNSDASQAGVDYLDNHLLLNKPKGGATGYPVTGRTPWRGPYQEQIALDPWGNPYLINIAATNPASGSEKAFVISAGPNGVVDTPFATNRSTQLAGDDVGTSFFVR